MKCHLSLIGNRTLAEAKRHAWKRADGDGLPEPPKVTQPGPARKLWRSPQLQKRKAS